MAGTLTVDTIQSDSSYASTLNVASKINFSGGMQLGGQDATLGGMRNRIINGDMRIDQRNAGGNINVTTDPNPLIMSVDRMNIGVTGGANVSAQQSTTAPAGFSNSLKLTVTTADASVAAGDYGFLRQRIEGYNIADFNLGTSNASPFTVSFWVQSSVTGTYSIGITNVGNGATYAASYSIPVANTWTKIAITIPACTIGTWSGNTTNGQGLELFFCLGNGSTYLGTPGSWQSGYLIGATGTTNWISTANATFYITGIQLEKGSVATAFEYRSYATEFALCQRYYQAPCGTSTTGIGQGGIATFYAVSVSEAFSTLQFPVAMRTAPTVTIYNSGGTAGGAHGLASVGDITGVTIDRVSSQGMGRLLKGSGFTAGYLYGCIYQANAEL